MTLTMDEAMEQLRWRLPPGTTYYIGRAETRIGMGQSTADDGSMVTYSVRITQAGLYDRSVTPCTPNVPLEKIVEIALQQYETWRRNHVVGAGMNQSN